MPRSSEMVRDEIDIKMAEKSRLGLLFPDDPEYVRDAWTDYATRMAADRVKGGNKRRFKVSWPTELAFRQFFSMVEYAAGEGYRTWARLDVRSSKPTCLPDDDAWKEDEE